MDTGGIEPGTDSDMLKFMRRQAEIAIETADVIIMVTDVTVGLTAADSEVATMLKRSKKPVVVAVNKCDRVGAPDPEFYAFYGLGLGDPIEVSAIHGHGTGDLLDACVAEFPRGGRGRGRGRPHQGGHRGQAQRGQVQPAQPDSRPGAGHRLQRGRTTRDAIDSDFENEFGKYCFIDTAGMRRKSKVDDAIEKYSNLRTISAIERADVCLILIDATEGVTEQDTKNRRSCPRSGQSLHPRGQQWDLVEKETNTMDKMTDEVRRDLSYMTYAPVLFLSALTGQRVNKLYQLINEVVAQSAMRISTGMLNNVLEDATARVQPPSDKGRRLKIYYMTQVA